MKAIWERCVLVLLLLLATGCGATQTYTGEKLLKEQVALIQRNTIQRLLYYVLTLNVADIDGIKPSQFQTYYEVLPGEHTLSIRVIWQTHLVAAPLVASKGLNLANNTITFRAEAGRNYRLNGEEGADKLFFVWLEDADTGSLVAGRRPGAAPQQ